MIANLKLITAPTVEPITVAEVKLHSRISTSADDTLLTNDIIAARMKCEQITGRCLITSTFDAYYDALPQDWTGEITLPKAPLQSVTSITYIATDGSTTVLSGSAYKVDAIQEPGRIVPAYGYTWPQARAEVNSVVIRFVAGYGLAVSVPQAIKNWLLITVADLYENRESIAIGGNIQEINERWTSSMLDAYIIPRAGM